MYSFIVFSSSVISTSSDSFLLVDPFLNSSCIEYSFVWLFFLIYLAIFLLFTYIFYFASFLQGKSSIFWSFFAYFSTKSDPIHARISGIVLFYENNVFWMSFTVCDECKLFIKIVQNLAKVASLFSHFSPSKRVVLMVWNIKTALIMIVLGCSSIYFIFCSHCFTFSFHWRHQIFSC